MNAKGAGKILAFSLTTAAALALAACSGGGGALIQGPTGGSGGTGGGSPGAQPSISLTSYSVTDANGQSVSPGSTPSTGSLGGTAGQGGAFTVRWNSQITNDVGAGYTAALYLGDTAGSTDTTGGHAVQVFQQNCDSGQGQTGTSVCPALTGTVPCTWNVAQQAMTCQTGSGNGQTVNIAQFLANHQAGENGTYDLTLQVCVFDLDSNGLSPQCDAKTVPVTLDGSAAGSGGSPGSGGTGSPASGSSVATPAAITLNGFAVDGTDGKTVTVPAGQNTTNVSAIIDGSENGGHFTMDWTATPSPDPTVGPQQIVVYLNTSQSSLDVTDGLATPILILDCNGGSKDDAACPTVQAKNIACQFDAAKMQFTCQTSLGAQSEPVGQFLSNNGGMQYTYFLSVLACGPAPSGQNPVCSNLQSLPISFSDSGVQLP